MSAEQTPPSPDTTAPVVIVPEGDDPLALVASRLLAANPDSHDLSHCVVLIPTARNAPRLQQLLLGHSGRAALLGPQVATLPEWLQQTVPGSPAQLPPHARELMLVEALQHHPQLVTRGNLWALADSLIPLFDELSAWNIGLPQGCSDFTALLASYYRVGDRTPPPLSQEARLVHTLWQAWHHQQRQERRHDPHFVHSARLRASLDLLPPHWQLYLVGYSTLLPEELSWAHALLEQGRLSLILHGEDPVLQQQGAVPAGLQTRLAAAAQQPAHSPDPYHALVQAALAGDSGDAPLAERARAFARHHPDSPASGRLAVLAAGDAEQEARGVDIQVRRWLLAGKKNIAIVCQDRRLARRVRALLERAGVALHDHAGWALSTSRAAATLERLLQAIEEDFAWQPLLDLLKSPFFMLDAEAADAETSARARHDSFRRTVFRLEQDIIRRENISRGLARYRAHVLYRQRRATGKSDEHAPLIRLLDGLETLSRPLRSYLRGRHRPLDMLATLSDCLDAAGLSAQFAADVAGERLLEELSQLRHALGDRSLTMDWSEFRAWLGRALERASFILPPRPGGPRVELLSPDQGTLGRFDALVIAAAEARHLPGSPAATPFFNDAVRQELGLPTAALHRAQRRQQFRCLLESAPAVLVSYHRSEESGLPSPWLQLIDTFHRVAYGRSLDDPELAALVMRNDTRIHDRSAALPAASVMPAPAVPDAQRPHSFSASMYQKLINCPYQFFAAHVLGLQAPEHLREVMEKADFGNRIHTALEAFHSDVAGLPGPCEAPLTAARRDQAIALLEQISRRVFARDLEGNAQHRYWLNLWLEHIPAYIDWQIAYHDTSPGGDTSTEVKARRERFYADTDLHGRLDRIDVDPQGQATLIDYKSGQLPSQRDIASGEHVQLPFYTLLLDRPVSRVMYLGVLARGPDGRPRVEQRQLAEAELETLAARSTQRLRQLLTAIAAGAALPAWGDEKTCRFCDMQGVCRKQGWNEALPE